MQSKKQSKGTRKRSKSNVALKKNSNSEETQAGKSQLKAERKPSKQAQVKQIKSRAKPSNSKAKLDRSSKGSKYEVVKRVAKAKAGKKQ